MKLLATVLLSFTFLLGRQDARAEDFYSVFGDSITAGALARFPLPLLPNSQTMAYQHTAFDISTRYESDMSLWASIKRVFKQAFNTKSLSWAVGTKFESLAGYVHSLPQYKNLHIDFRAKSGDRTKGFVRQVKESLEDLRPGKDQIKLASVLIGANNFCARSAPDNDPRFALGELTEGIDLLLKSTDAKILLFNFPNPGKILRLADSYTFDKLQCRDLWQSPVHYCHEILVKSPDEIDQIFSQWHSLWENYGRDLELRYPDRVLWFETLYELQPEGSDIAIDCFHPSGSGQKKIARAIIEKLNREKSFLEK